MECLGQTGVVSLLRNSPLVGWLPLVTEMRRDAWAVRPRGQIIRQGFASNRRHHAFSFCPSDSLYKYNPSVRQNVVCPFTHNVLSEVCFRRIREGRQEV